MRGTVLLGLAAERPDPAPGRRADTLRFAACGGAMSNDFIPEGWLTPASAIEVVAARRFGNGLVSALTPDDHKKLEDWQECRQASRQVRFGHGYIIMDDVGPEYPLEPPEVTATKRKEDDFKAQRAEATDWLRKKLYSGAIPSIILTDDGHHCAVPTHVWASESFESILLSGTAEIGGSVSGRVFLSAAELQAVLEGRTIPQEDAANHAGTSRREPEGPPRAKGGRRHTYDWPAFEQEAIRLLEEEGLPTRTNEKGWRCQADLERRLVAWCEDRWGEENVPAESMIRKHVKDAIKEYTRGREGR